MRLALDVRTLNSPKTGDRTVTRGLLQALLDLELPDLEVIAVSDRPLPAGLIRHDERLEVRLATWPGGYLWTPLALPRALRAVRADVALLHYLGPLLGCPCPFLTLVHDTVWRTMPETFPWRHRLMLDAFLPPTIRRAAAVYTVSEFSAGEIARYFPEAASKLRVIPNGVDPVYQPVTDPVKLATVRARYGLPERFILSVGVLQPRKNVAGLIAAYRRLPEALQRDYGLVIVGKQGWLMASLPHLAAQAGPGVLFTGYVDDGDLPALYTLADVFAYPSLYEGFGLPPVEAMACGTPVLTSTAASLPEVTRNAALLVDPTDEAALAAGLERLLTDEALREQLLERGFARAAELTWEQAARRLVEVCREVSL